MSKKDYGEHVFIVGSSRSGTTLVHSILMSNSSYAVYRAESQLLKDCDLVYGDLASKQFRDKFLSDWFRSRQYHRSGLTMEEVLGVFNTEDKPSYIWFLSKYMNMVACKQNKSKWVDSTPGNVFSLSEISKYFPNARIIHVVRDGRAVALSRTKLGWCGMGTKDFDKGLGYSSLMWEESVRAVSDTKNNLSGRFLEVKYEELVESPDKIITKLSKFLDIPDLDCSHIRTQNNSAFGDLTDGISDSAVSRWKTMLSNEQVAKLEGFVGKTLKMHDYPITQQGGLRVKFICEKNWYKLLLYLKSRLKRIAIMRRFIATPLELDMD